MFVYQINSLPDLTLNKYQALGDSSIDSMLEAQTRLLRQLYRLAAYEKISIHFLFEYDPARANGTKLNIQIAFTNIGDENKYNRSLDKLVKSSNIFEQFQLKQISKDDISEMVYSIKAEMRKKERILQTLINGASRSYYIVPNWKVNEEARLFSLFKLMESFDEKCCYRVDIYSIEGLNENIHKNFEKPLNFLRGGNIQQTGMETTFCKSILNKDPNVEETLNQYEEWLTKVDESNIFRCRISAYTDNEQYARLLLDTAFAESVSIGNNTIQMLKGHFSKWDDLHMLPMKCCLKETPLTMEEWATTYTTDEIAAFVRLPVLNDGEHIELPKETASVLIEDGIDIGKDKKRL